MLIIFANKTQTEYSAEEIKSLLTSPRTLIFVGVQIFAIAINLCILARFLARLRQFEADVDSYQDRQTERDNLILPERERKQIGGETNPEVNELRNNNSTALLGLNKVDSEIDQSPVESVQYEEMQRPARILIDAINDMPDEQIEKVSPQSVGLKTWNKIPMILLTVSSALQGSLTVVGVKLLMETI